MAGESIYIVKETPSAKDRSWHSRLRTLIFVFTREDAITPFLILDTEQNRDYAQTEASVREHHNTRAA
jgi:hypothetical protein